MSTDLPDIRRGMRLSQVPARQWRNLVDSVRSLLNATGANGLTIDKRPSGFVYRQKREQKAKAQIEATRGSVFSAAVHFVSTLDYLGVRPYDQNLGDFVPVEELIYVALPWSLRRAPFDNKTWDGVLYRYETSERRRAIAAGAEQTEIIIPPYIRNADDGTLMIIKVRQVDWTGVADPLVPGRMLTLEDANDHGRAWARIEV